MSGLAWVNIAVSLVLPLLVGYFTKQSWNRNLKAVLLLALAALAAFGTDLLAVGSFEGWKSLLSQAVLNWLVAVATYYHVWKPTGVAVAVQESGIVDVPPEPESS
jgi:uncharacterized protein YjeT (DUF2065 family)